MWLRIRELFVLGKLLGPRGLGIWRCAPTWSRAYPATMAEPVNKRSKTTDSYCLRLVQFESEGRQRVGVLTSIDGDVVDICAADSNIPTDMKQFLEEGDSAMQAAEL